MTSPSGANLTITSKDEGTYSDDSYALTVTYDSVHFTQAPFGASSMPGDLSGGQNTPLYNWTINSYAPNGDVLAVTDLVMGTWSYAYDSFNRLVSGSATSGSLSGMGLAWDYDRYGNRWDQNVSGSGSAVQTHFTFNSNNNRIDGDTYDADGNLKNDGTNAYAYGAENRITTLNGQSMYVYDAESRRVAKLGSGGVVTATYILGLGGQQVTEINGSGQWVHSNVYTPAGRLLATYEGPGGPATAGYHYHLTDWLGTERIQTNANGVEEESCQSNPFGDGLSCLGTDATEQHFTGKERNRESGLDYFGARYISSNFGRFMTPDWAAAPTAVPYARFGDPQSLDLYAYVGNNPNTGVDADGHMGPDPAAAEQNAEMQDAAGKADSVGKQGTSSSTTSTSQTNQPGEKNTDGAQQEHYQHQATQQANVPVTVSKVSANNPLGHSTIQVGSGPAVGLVPDSTKQAAAAVGKQAIGLAMTGTAPPESVPGHIEKSNEQAQASTTIYVTSGQADGMRTYIGQTSSQPQRYDAAYHNCVDYNENVLSAGGISPQQL